jgi:hypothetical protein
MSTDDKGKVAGSASGQPGSASTQTQNPSDKRWTDAEVEYLGKVHAEKYANEKHSKLDKMLAEANKLAEAAGKDAGTLREQITTMESELNDLRTKGGAGDVVALKKQLAAKEAELKKREEAADLGLQKVNDFERDKRIKEAAEKYEPDTALRAKFVEALTKLKPQNAAQVDEFAASISVYKANPESTSVPAEVTGGSGTGSTFMSNEEQIRKAKEKKGRS